MAIIWADFPSGQQGIYGTNTGRMTDGIWAEVGSNVFGSSSLVEDPDPNISGNVLFGGNSNGERATRIVNPSGAQVTTGVAFRLFLPNLPSDTARSAYTRFNTSANVPICSISVQPDGSLRAHSGSLGTTLGTTAVPVITANSWNHIEMKVVRDAAVGTIEVRVNGVTVLNLSNLALGANNIGQIQLVALEQHAYWKDFLLWDGTGSEGNDFQGSVAVRDLYPDADISLNWTPSTGSTGWDLIDETTPNDADYIGAPDPAPAAYVASLTDLPEDVTSVRALLPIYRATKTDGGDCNVQVGITPDNTNWDDGADRPMTTAFTYWWDVSHLSPATLAPWTPVEVNAAYVRADRTL